MAHDSKAKVLKVGTLHTSLISTEVSLVGSFILHFKLPMGVSAAIMIILARVAVSL